MTTIVRWDPLRELGTLQGRLNRAFDEVWGRSRSDEDAALTGNWVPAVDVRETKDALELAVEVPGIEPKDVEVAFENGVLSLKGERQFEKASEGESYHRVERAYGTFLRTFTLPTNVDPDKIQAVYRHGVLLLTLPKREEAKPKSIAIKVQEK
jgi:HSP20 family protein